jgi:hypothetical protein
VLAWRKRPNARTDTTFLGGLGTQPIQNGTASAITVKTAAPKQNAITSFAMYGMTASC